MLVRAPAGREGEHAQAHISNMPVPTAPGGCRHASPPACMLTHTCAHTCGAPCPGRCFLSPSGEERQSFPGNLAASPESHQGRGVSERGGRGGGPLIP